MPKISIIIPCYNASAYIDRCFAALENQIYSDFEVIAIDDCSTDDTVDKIMLWQNKGILSICLLQNKVNSGPAYSRNRGISQAKGNFISFCDIDDWYDKDYLDEMIKAQTCYDADMVFCGYKLVFDSTKQLRHPLNAGCNSTQNKESVLLLGIDSLCSILVKKSIISEIPQPDLRNGEDMAIIPLLIINSNKFAFVKEEPYNYYCRSGSASLSPTPAMIESLNKSFNHILSNMPEEYLPITEFIGIKNLIYGSILNTFKISYNKEQAKQIIKGFECNFPHWRDNRHIKSLPIFKRIFIRCLSKSNYFFTFLLSRFHMFMTK